MKRFESVVVLPVNTGGAERKMFGNFPYCSCKKRVRRTSDNGSKLEITWGGLKKTETREEKNTVCEEKNI